MDAVGRPWSDSIGAGVVLTLFGPGGVQAARWSRPARARRGVVVMQYPLSAGAPLGRWTLALNAGNQDARVNFVVREPKSIGCKMVLPSDRFSWGDSPNGRLEVFYSDNMETFPAEVVLEAVSVGE